MISPTSTNLKFVFVSICFAFCIKVKSWESKRISLCSSTFFISHQPFVFGYKTALILKIVFSAIAQAQEWYSPCMETVSSTACSKGGSVTKNRTSQFDTNLFSFHKNFSTHVKIEDRVIVLYCVMVFHHLIITPHPLFLSRITELFFIFFFQFQDAAVNFHLHVEFIPLEYCQRNHVVRETRNMIEWKMKFLWWWLIIYF